MPSPVLSLIIPSKSLDDQGLQRLLQSLKRQTFNDYEVLVETQGNSEEAKGHALRKARGEIVGFFCTDNDLRDSTFLKTMVWYARQPGITGAYTAQYDYIPGDHMLSRYFALLGANDPLCWWLGKADRQSYLSVQRIRTQIRRYNRTLPSLGDNGCFIKRSLIQQATFTPETFGSCMCFCEDLRRLGHSTWWIVAEQKLWHRTGEDWIDYFRRRYHYVKYLYFEKQHIRRWRMVESTQDYLRMVWFVLASLVVFPHLITVIRGYHRVRDLAWFLHPVICFGLVFIYGTAWLMWWLQLLFQPLRGQKVSSGVSAV